MKKIIGNIAGEICYVAFLDILGFKEEVLKKYSTVDVAKIFMNIKQIRKNCLKKNGFDKEYDYALQETVIRIMSDSIVISTPIKFENSLSIVAEICMLIQMELIKVHHILLRGAISKGGFFYDEEIMFGQGLVNAYINEGKAKNPRITILKELVDEYVERVGTSRITYITDFLLKDIDGIYFINYFHERELFKEWGKEQKKIQVHKYVHEKYVWLYKWINSSDEEIYSRLVEKDYPQLFHGTIEDNGKI